MTQLRALALLVLLALVLGGCADRAPQLMNLRADSGSPDEFAVLPRNEIEMPADLSTLPAPLADGANRTDPDPRGAAIAALGGDPALARRDGRPGADGALLAQAGGAAPTIRADLAAEDLAFRKANRGRLLERWARINTYYTAYQPQSLDQQRALDAARAAGVAGPSAPPALPPQP